VAWHSPRAPVYLAVVLLLPPCVTAKRANLRDRLRNAVIAIMASSAALPGQSDDWDDRKERVARPRSSGAVGGAVAVSWSVGCHAELIPAASILAAAGISKSGASFSATAVLTTSANVLLVSRPGAAKGVERCLKPKLAPDMASRKRRPPSDAATACTSPRRIGLSERR
jgi:hypothetical protein